MANPITAQDIYRYQAYMVRLWQDDGQTTWRASVQSVQSGEVIRFSSLVALFEYLQSQTDIESGIDSEETEQYLTE